MKVMGAAPERMTAAGFNWPNIETLALEVLSLLEKDTPFAIDAARQILKSIDFFTGGSFNIAGIIAALGAATVDVKQIIADVKAAFGL